MDQIMELALDIEDKSFTRFGNLGQQEDPYEKGSLPRTKTSFSEFNTPKKFVIPPFQSLYLIFKLYFLVHIIY